MHDAPRPHDAEPIGTLYHPDMAAIGAEAARARLAPARAGPPGIHLLIVDMQVDFCHADGALSVPGAREDLQRLGRSELTVWPYHCLIGSPGHCLDPDLLAVVLWHSLARGTQPNWWMKGSIPGTEHYSILRPEIPVPGHPLGTGGRELLDLLEASDSIFIAGEAKSHCVLETVEDLVEAFADRPDVLGRIFVLQDCTSSIRHPNIDYEAVTNARFAELARRGIHLVDSTDPLPI